MTEEDRTFWQVLAAVVLATVAIGAFTYAWKHIPPPCPTGEEQRCTETRGWVGGYPAELETCTCVRDGGP